MTEDSGQAGTSEIEITPEMTQAGVLELYHRCPDAPLGAGGEVELVNDIFRAMVVQRGRRES